MKCLSRIGLTAAPFALIIMMNAPAFAGTAGTVAIVEGSAFAQKGQIYFTRPNVGGEVKVNQFGQYKDSKPVPAFVKWIQNTRRHLKPNDQIEEGDIIQTMGDAWTKILFTDDSMIDIGPAAIVQVEKFVNEGNNRNVLLKVLYGRVRNVVARPLAGPQRYQVITPTALMGVRGTEFIVNAFPDKDHRTQTEVACLHGQVSLDVAKFTPKGLVYHQPMVLNPGAVFATSGVHGLSEKLQMKALPQENLRSVVARISPMVNTRATLIGASPPPTRLPGTGLRMQYVADATPRKVRESSVSTFDSDHPPADRQIAAPSDNFTVAHDFKNDPAGFGNLKDPRRFTGTPPVQYLPATTSRVRVILTGPGF